MHARRLSEQSRNELKGVVNAAGDNTDAASMSIGPAVIRNGADFMSERLGFGNKCLFLDIYPLHRFYMERGAKEFQDSVRFRQNLRGRVNWDAKKLLDFGKPFQEIYRGFELIEQEKLAESVQALARHEQVNILQTILYDDLQMQRALAANQFAWANEFPSGVYMEIQLTLSAQCNAKDGLTSYFPRARKAKLWVVGDRMKFVIRAAGKFDNLLQGKNRPLVDESLQVIASGGGVR